MSGQKHDEACAKRREDPRYMFVCTCGMTDVEVATFENQNKDQSDPTYD